jgi:hypothetical protein
MARTTNLYFPTEVPAAPYKPRVVADAYSDLEKAKRWCTCCERPLVRKFAYLELDQRFNVYHDFGGVPPLQSQGWFPFGMTCAKRLLGEAATKFKVAA